MGRLIQVCAIVSAKSIARTWTHGSLARIGWTQPDSDSDLRYWTSAVRITTGHTTTIKKVQELTIG